jgi:hypothetical protein
MVTDKIRVDANELTLAEHGEAARVAAAHGIKPDDPAAQFYSVAAMAWLIHRRVDATFTYEQALQLKMSDLDLVQGDEGPEVLAASNGGVPQSSPVSGS